VSLFARPKGDLAVIWKLDGNSVLNQDACDVRSGQLADRRAQLQANGLRGDAITTARSRPTTSCLTRARS
jgi:hypothetical protein